MPQSGIDILENISDGFLAFDKDWNFTYLNTQGAKTLGRSASSLLGKNLWTEFPELSQTPFGQLYKESMADGKFREYEDYYEPFQAWFSVRVYPNETGLVLYFQNINDRKKLERELHESRNYFRKLSDTVPVIIWITELDQQCSYLNSQWYFYTGQASLEGLGFGWLKMVHPEDVGKATAAFLSAHAKKEAFSNTYRLKNRNNDYRWVTGFGVPKYDEKQNFEGFIGTVVDIHEKVIFAEELETLVQERTAELITKNEELRRQNDFIEAIQDASLDLIAVYDKDGRFVAFNKKCEQEFGKTKEEVIGKTFLEVFPTRETSSPYQDLQKALKGEAVHTTGYQAIAPNRFFESFTIPLKNDNHEVHGVLATAHEITSTVEAKRKLEVANSLLKQQKDFAEALLDSSVDMISVFDPELRFIAFNKSCARAYQMTPDMIGGKLVELFPKTLNSPTLECLQKALKGEATLGLKHKSVVVGKYYESFFIPLTNNNEMYAVMMIHHDVSDIVLASEELEKSNRALAEKNKELETSNDELGQFAYIASHDLQEPLRKIQTFAEMLELNLSDAEKSKHYLHKIIASANRMSGLIKDVLQYSRISKSGDLFKLTDLNLILEEVKQDYELLIEQKQVSIVNQHLPHIKAIPLQLHQLFSNLIGNAIKFNTGLPFIQIACELVTNTKLPFVNNSHSHFYKISFKDNGIGFEQQYADKIFTVFQRLNNHYQYSGSGIGLAIAKKIVENHEGFITVKSEPGKGSEFIVYLPATTPMTKNI